MSGREHAVARTGHQDLAQQSLTSEVHDGRQAAEVPVDVVRPTHCRRFDRPAYNAQNVDEARRQDPGDRGATLDIVDDAEYAHHRCGQDRGRRSGCRTRRCRR